jgi:hypothetical protein
VPVVALQLLNFATNSAKANNNGTIPGGLLLLTGIAIIVMFIVVIIVGPALTYALLKSAQQQRISPKEAYKFGAPYIGRYFGLCILLGIIYIVSLLLFIIPFFFVLPRYYLAPYYLIDRNLSIKEALKQSAEDYKHHHGVWGVIGVQVLLEIPNIIPFIGWLISLVLGFTYLAAPAVRYLEIKRIATPPQPSITPENPTPVTKAKSPKHPAASESPVAPRRPLVQ